MAQRVEYRWRGAITDTEMVDLVRSHGGHAVPGWWDQIRPYSMGWVSIAGGGPWLACPFWCGSGTV
jgi:hypothetical protein